MFILISVWVFLLVCYLNLIVNRNYFCLKYMLELYADVSRSSAIRARVRVAVCVARSTPCLRNIFRLFEPDPGQAGVAIGKSGILGSSQG